MSHKITLNVNGTNVNCNINSNQTLLELLRDELNIKSVKAACFQGDCGLCTVLLDNTPVKSCLVLGIEANNKSITTVEGLSSEGKLSTLQQSFIKYGAVQCGFCTGAFLLMGHYLIQEYKNNLTRELIKEGINGILCRCTGYQQIIDAIYNTVHVND